MAVSNVELRVDSRQAVNALRDVNRASAQTDSAISKLQGTIGKLAGAFTAIQAARFVFVKTAEIESQTRSLQVLTGSAQQAKQIVQELQQLGAVTPFTSSELIDAAKRLQAFGVESSKIVETTSRLGDAAGATGANLGELTTAYGQVISKGRLQGEELLQFQERGIALQQELRKMYGMTGEEFSKALSKGQISAKAVEVALQRLTSAGGKYANGAIAQSDTLNGKLSTLQDSFQRLAQNIGRFFEPVFKFLLDGINAFLERVNSASALQAQTRAYQQASERTRARFGARVMNPFDTEVQQYRARLEKSLVKTEMGASAPSFRPASRATATPALLSPSGAGDAAAKRAAKESERAAKAAAEEQARVAQIVRDRMAEGQLIQLKSALQDKISAAEIAGDKQLVARLKGQERGLDIEFRYAQELAQTKDIKAQQATIYKGISEQVANQRDIERELAAIDQQRIKDGAQLLADKQSELDLLKQTDPLKRDLLQIEQYLKSEEIAKLNLTQSQLDQLRKILTATAQIKNASSGLKSLYADIGMSLKSGIVDAIQGAIDGTKSLGDVASQVLRNIANKLLDVAINMALFGEMSGTGSGGGLLGGLFKPSPRAMGGSVRAGQPYLVGERGPELFMPGRSGGIAPTGSFGGGVNVVVNVDASGSSVQGDDQRANQLGRVVSVAVQQEIVKQKRPGGLLT
jgi:tape measure domain-containing protein